MSTARVLRSKAVCGFAALSTLLSTSTAEAQFTPTISPPDVVKRNANVSELDSATDGVIGDGSAYAAMDRSGYWVAVWAMGGGGVGTIVYVRSTSGTCTPVAPPAPAGFCGGGIHLPDTKPCTSDLDCRWTATAPILPVPDGLVDSFENVTTDGQGNWVVLYGSSTFTGGGQPGGLKAMWRNDNDATWQGPVTIAVDPEGPPVGSKSAHVATDGQGAWVAVWQNIASVPDPFSFGGNFEQDNFISRSVDNGATWSSPAIFADGATDALGDYFTADRVPTIATDGNGNWVAVWSRGVTRKDGACCGGPGSGILHSQSSDNGVTWSAPGIVLETVDGGSGVVAQYPPQIVTDHGGTWIAVWQAYGGPTGNDSDILFARSTDNGATWTTAAPLNSWATTDNSNVYPENWDWYPVAAADSHGNWLVTWHSGTDHSGSGTDGDVWIVRSTNYGVTWTEPVLVNGTNDSGADAVATFATDENGNWIVLWSSNNTFVGTALEGTAGPDDEPLIAQFAFPDCNGNFQNDSRDITLGVSADANHNGIPDECVGFVITDCNGNGIEDAVDISGGRSRDCNGDTIPDDCEMSGCTTNPSCHDCNNNGLLDGCDIAQGQSADESPADGVPDECISSGPLLANVTAAGCGNNWSCPDNWDLDGGYPDNVGAARYAVKMGPTTGVMNLDVSVALDTVELASAAQLNVGNVDVELRRPGGLRAFGKVEMGPSATMTIPGGPFEFRGALASFGPGTGGASAASVAALDIVAADGAVVTAKDAMLLTAYRDVLVSADARAYFANAAAMRADRGRLTVAAGGVVAEDPAATTATQAQISARDAVLEAATAALAPGQIVLKKNIGLYVDNSFLIAGELQLAGAGTVQVAAHADNPGMRVAAGGKISPIPGDAAASTAAITAGVVSIDGEMSTPQIRPAASLELRKDMRLDVDRSLRVEGNLLVGEQALVRTVGEMRMAGTGLYGKAVGALAPSATLEAAVGFIEDRAELNLEGTMSATFSGSLTVTGQTAAFNVAGTIPPPKIIQLGNASVTCGGPLSMTGRAAWTNASTAGLFLGGDFDNRSILPSQFRMEAGAVTLQGAMPQTFEVAGIDLGATADGYHTDVDALFDPDPSTNSAIGTMRVAAGSQVDFVNNFANTVGPGPCHEALYVNTLRLDAGAAISLHDVNVFYGHLVDEGATIMRLGCGDLRPVPLPPAIVWNPNPLAATRAGRTLTMTLQAATAAAPGTAALGIKMVDLQHPNPRNRPANPPPNFTTFDTTVNSACVGGQYAGHHCDTSADCTGTTNGTCPVGVGCSALGETNGCTRWVGPVTTFREKQGVLGLGTYKAGRLQCTPYYADWTAVGPFSVFGAEIIPSSTYEGVTYGANCDGVESTCLNVSSPVTMTTRRSGDVASPWNPPDTGDQPTGGDVGEVLNKFKGSPGSPSNIAALIFGNVPDPNTDVGGQEIGETVNSFKGLAYPFSGPCACPSTVTCGATACSSTNTAPCGAGLCVLTCVGGANDGLPCRDFPPNAPADHCPGGSCPTDGFCRDRCGRCD